MNERIQKLAEQAGINCVVPTVGTLEYPSKGEVNHLKSFAELIVRECAYIPIDMWDKAELNADVAVKIEDRIKQHFGVEE